MELHQNSNSDLRNDDNLEQPIVITPAHVYTTEKEYVAPVDDESIDLTVRGGETPEELERINEKAAAIYAAKKAGEHGEDGDQVNQTSAAIHATQSPGKLASSFRDPNRQTGRANEATDRNDTGSGGLSAGGVKSGSSLQ